MTVTHPIRHGRPGRPTGFTLIEVVLVIVIAGLIGAIAVPRYAASLARYGADSAARRVVDDLNYARQRAAAKSQSVTVAFDPAADTYRLSGVPDLDHPDQVYTTDLQADPYAADLTAADFNGRAFVVFDGFGQPDYGGSVKLAGNARTIVITVDPTTGQASTP